MDIRDERDLVRFVYEEEFLTGFLFRSAFCGFAKLECLAAKARIVETVH